VAAVLRLGVLASGRGSNLQAILDATREPSYPARVAVVISDREAAPALDRARQAGVPAVFMNPKDFGDRSAYEAALSTELASRQVGLVCLAGFMRLLGPAFVATWSGRVLNVHPSLLPAFPGLAPQRQALEHGVRVAGATVHFVDEGVDSGPIVLQEAVLVAPDDTEATLAARILAAEHRLYPQAIRLFAEGRMQIDGRRVVIRPAAG
jgi:phosphoribosylglycinamide formyltransferase-1